MLDHPTLNRPVRLDAQALEVQSLFDAADQFVTLEVVLPGQSPRKLVVPNDMFDKVFQADVDETLAAAETYSPARETAAPALRGRPAGGAAKQVPPNAMSREQRGAVRDWSNNNGYQVGDRGRIKTEILTAFEAAHSN